MEHPKKLPHTPGKGWDRFRAAIVDSVYVGIINSLLTLLLLALHLNASVITGVTLAVYLGYAVYFTVTRGQTFGKEAFGLTVVQRRTEHHVTYPQALLREFMKNGVAIVPYIGALYYIINGAIVIFSKEKRGWHDMIAGTQVIKVGERWNTTKQILLIILPLFVLASLVMVLNSKKIV